MPTQEGYTFSVTVPRASFAKLTTALGFPGTPEGETEDRLLEWIENITEGFGGVELVVDDEGAHLSGGVSPCSQSYSESERVTALVALGMPGDAVLVEYSEDGGGCFLLLNVGEGRVETHEPERRWPSLVKLDTLTTRQATKRARVAFEQLGVTP